jgi:hypothetical protein
MVGKHPIVVARQLADAWTGCIASFTLRTRTGSPTELSIITLVPGASPTVPVTVPVTEPVTLTEPVTGTGLAAVFVTDTGVSGDGFTSGGAAKADEATSSSNAAPMPFSFMEVLLR